jgi:3,4-dihydroxy 2-butanone 4-phosphate synthase/GTP cyclohydrolase II
VTPFKPHALPDARRFIATASYFLPVRPVDHEVVVGTADLEAWPRDDAGFSRAANERIDAASTS